MDDSARQQSRVLQGLPLRTQQGPAGQSPGGKEAKGAVKTAGRTAGRTAADEPLAGRILNPAASETR